MLVYNIEMLCERHGISVSRLEEQTGISQGTIRTWKTRSPRLDTLKKVADYFHVTLDELIGVEEQSSA